MEDIQRPSEPVNCKNFAGGDWLSQSGKNIDVYSPLFGDKIGNFKSSTSDDVKKLVAKASQAYPLWRDTPLKERTQIMFRFREILIRDMDKISSIVSLENGKTVAESKAGILKGIEVLEFALSLQNLDSMGTMEVSRGVQCEYRREPLGVVASITPFNFPAMVPMWTIPIALTVGNCYVWKPSEKTPLTSQYLGKALEEAGIPKGVFSIAQGDRETVEALIDHKDVKAISFVGSTKVAKAVYQRATNLGKRCLALGGAKNHIILMPDADINLCYGISDSFTGCAGQRCMAAAVVLAVGDVDKQIEEIKKRANSMVLGKDMGAIITKEQVDFLQGAIDQAVKDGATLLVDGRNQTADGNLKQGYWIGPTILDNVKPGSQAATHELFGPVLAIIRCKNLSEALEIENSIDYGNACSVFTQNGAVAERVAREARAGMIGVNIGVPVPREPFSFGGINDSKFGHGDITGAHSLDFWSNIKKVTKKWELQKDTNWMG
jgi:malonate-semialdehyde dehydrogenase (acetylating) / methylmalonate-semialdehyde dehydrogenase